LPLTIAQRFNAGISMTRKDPVPPGTEEAFALRAGLLPFNFFNTVNYLDDKS